MKAERRHELNQNSLAKNIENAPAFFQQHGSRILLAVILFLLAFIWARYYSDSKASRSRAASEALGTATYALSRLQSLPYYESQEGLASQRRNYAHDAEVSLTEALKSENPLVRTQALLVRGNLNWTMATFPALPTAATRPELQPDKTPGDYLKAAADAYNQVLQTAPVEDAHDRVSAKLGLAAIAENRSEWSEATKNYQQVVDDASAGEGFKDYAKKRLEQVKNFQKPTFLGSASDEIHFRRPAPPPAFVGPRNPLLNGPTTAPATQPIGVGARP